MVSLRRGVYQRETRETRVSIDLLLDGSGQYSVSTSVGMLDHLLEQLARHGMIDLTIDAQGDIDRDQHHLVEDVGIGLGRALNEALGERRGIVRFAHHAVALDESLAEVTLDVSGRPFAVLHLPFGSERIGQLPTQLIGHLLQSFALEARLTLHARILYGENDHHKAEALFKALARALREATSIDPRLGGEAPSTKGVIG